MITDYLGREYIRDAFTPHGEIWQEDSSDTLDKIDYLFTGKQVDSETGWYNFGKRYLDPKTALWLSADPALGDYIPKAPLTDDDRKANGNLPGMGGFFNPINFALYHFAGNNPIRYTDPDGKEPKTPETMRTYYAPSEALMGVQDNVRDDPKLQPGTGGPYNVAHTADTTWCNIGTDRVISGYSNNLKAFIGDADPDNTKANTMIDLMDAKVNAGTLKETSSPEFATKLANEGYTVVAGWKNPDPEKEGHVATLRPSSSPNSTKDPLVSNVGVMNEILPQDNKGAFGGNKVIEYYYDPNQKLDQNN